MKNYPVLYLAFARAGAGHYWWGAVLQGDKGCRMWTWTGTRPTHDQETTTEVLADIVSSLGLTDNDLLTVVSRYDVTTKIRAGWTFHEFTPGGYVYRAGVEEDNRFWDAAEHLAAWAAE